MVPSQKDALTKAGLTESEIQKIADLGYDDPEVLYGLYSAYPEGPVQLFGEDRALEIKKGLETSLPPDVVQALSQPYSPPSLGVPLMPKMP